VKPGYLLTKLYAFSPENKNVSHFFQYCPFLAVLLLLFLTSSGFEVLMKSVASTDEVVCIILLNCVFHWIDLCRLLQ
jgi:uncharacterized membrane protein